jgi:hypothetical protein
MCDMKDLDTSLSTTHRKFCGQNAKGFWPMATRATRVKGYLRRRLDLGCPHGVCTPAGEQPPVPLLRSCARSVLTGVLTRVEQNDAQLPVDRTRVEQSIQKNAFEYTQTCIMFVLGL